jgi:hypothetical protein
VKKLIVALAALGAFMIVPAAAASGWTASVPFTNVVASSPATGGGYPDPDSTPDPGTCTSGTFTNRSESWIANDPGTENLVGTSKFFFDIYSTFYNFYLGSYTILNGNPVANNQVQGYDCLSTGTQAMPPSWTNSTDPNVDFDTKHRAYQVVLPFNAYWTNLHPNGAIYLSYSDDYGRTWQTGNGGQPLEHSPNQSSLAFGHVEDKQWVAVDHFPTSRCADTVYAMWAVFNGAAVKVRYAISRDRGMTFEKDRTLSAPSQVGPAVTYVYPSVGADGTVYAAVVSFPPSGKASNIYVTSSRDCGRTWAPFNVAVSDVGIYPGVSLPNTRFRDGIVESFVASPTYPGHTYLTWENWDGAQFDVYFSHSENYGATWAAPQLVNDNVDSGTATDQFQPSVAAGPGGAVAVAFYDRRQACPTGDPSISRPGAVNFCIDTSLQAYKDTGAGPVKRGANVRISEFTWDPEQPLQTVDGIGQISCPAHSDPCPVTFIGDYFGLAVSGTSIYALFVSTHYPSGVMGDDAQGPVYYQQQVLAKVPRMGFGSDY